MECASLRYETRISTNLTFTLDGGTMIFVVVMPVLHEWCSDVPNDTPHNKYRIKQYLQQYFLGVL